MRRFFGLMALGAACSLGGCSSGDDVFIETGATRSGVCALSRGDDVCAQPWTDVPVESRPEVVSWLQQVVSFASEARTMLDELDAACTEMLGSLGVEAPVIDDRAARAASTAATCKTASDAIRARRSTKLSVVELERPTCEDLPAPSCVLPMSPPPRACTPARVTLEPAKVPADAALAQAISPGLGRVLTTRERIARLGELGARIASAPTREGQLAVPECVVPSTMSLVSEGSAEVKAALEIVGDISAAIER